MGTMSRNDMMLQATRLTRANRLIEATALIQRMLRGETDSVIARLGNGPPTIDGYAETIDETPLPWGSSVGRQRLSDRMG